MIKIGFKRVAKYVAVGLIAFKLGVYYGELKTRAGYNIKEKVTEYAPMAKGELERRVFENE